MNPTAARGKWAKPWLIGSWVVILLTTLTVPAWAESFADLYARAAITQNHGLTGTEPGEVNVLNDVKFDTSVTPGEPLLTSPEFSKARFRPYVTAGPAISIGQGEDSANFFLPNQPDTDTSLKVGAGVAWSPLRNIEIFGEYRPGFEFGGRVEPVTLETDVNTHHILGGGISFRY